MKRLILTLALLIAGMSCAFSQDYFRNGMFLNHSTGLCIWDPNPYGGSTTTIPDQLHLCNTAHRYTGNDSISMEEYWWDEPGDNEWSTLDPFFMGDTAFSNGISPQFSISYCLNHYKILVVKSCFPSSNLAEWGHASDTLDPTYKSVYNNKWHWRHMVRAMQYHPDNFFVIWTNASLASAVTTPEEATLSRSFCLWAKDTLAAGIDPVFGAFPANVYVFDYFGKLTDANGYMLPQFAAPDWSHPGGTATDLVAPQFVSEIFDHAIAFETLFGTTFETNPVNLFLSATPNPFNSNTTIRFITTGKYNAGLTLSDSQGRRIRSLWSACRQGEHQVTLSGTDLSNGTYILQLSEGERIRTVKVVHGDGNPN